MIKHLSSEKISFWPKVLEDTVHLHREGADSRSWSHCLPRQETNASKEVRHQDQTSVHSMRLQLVKVAQHSQTALGARDQVSNLLAYERQLTFKP